MADADAQDFSPERTTVWDFPERGAWATHRSDYRGNFAPQIPRNVILAYSDENELILDPMVGSGTTLVEARLLGRNAIGLDINAHAVKIARERISFEASTQTQQTVAVGDVRKMTKIPDDHVDLIVTHPPYLDLVKYSDGQNPNDLSSFSSISTYMQQLALGIAEMYRVLRSGRYCAILIGDTRRGQHFVPLSHFVLRQCLAQGFVLKEDIIKTQHNTMHGRRWAPSAKKFKFFLIMHEHLFVLRKPNAGESLSRIRYSTWSGFSSLG